jgi:trigger factor
MEQARRYPGQERHVYDYYQKNPNALIELRAPIFEDKVVDLIVSRAKPAEKKVSPAELMQPDEPDAALGLTHVHDHEHDHGHDHAGHDHEHDHPGHQHEHDHTHDHSHGDQGHSHDHDHGEKKT